jgi:uncharacterized protein YueI|tara:strand:- start:202 stop:396 length:195 start_codon:yes stop_codon:yes gene_type:complete
MPINIRSCGRYVGKEEWSTTVYPVVVANDVTVNKEEIKIEVDISELFNQMVNKKITKAKNSIFQ